MSEKPQWEIIHGDSLTVLESFPPGTFDAVITDPPYASGGRTQAEKSKATAKSIPAWVAMPRLTLTEMPKIRDPGRAGQRNGSIFTPCFKTRCSGVYVY